MDTELKGMRMAAVGDKCPLTATPRPNMLYKTATRYDQCTMVTPERPIE
ncbi:MAG: hypothetical protein R2778_09340 [Saprospiraceae bacterium]